MHIWKISLPHLPSGYSYDKHLAAPCHTLPLQTGHKVKCKCRSPTWTAVFHRTVGFIHWIAAAAAKTAAASDVWINALNGHGSKLMSGFWKLEHSQFFSKYSTPTSEFFRFFFRQKRAFLKTMAHPHRQCHRGTKIHRDNAWRSPNRQRDRSVAQVLGAA